MSFAPDGRAKGYLQGANWPEENTKGTLRYATESEFCRRMRRKRRQPFLEFSCLRTSHGC